MDFFRKLTALLLLFLSFDCVCSFPGGAPAKACKSLLPEHEGTIPSSNEDSPYTFVASDNKYSYNNPQTIKVEIYGAPFKGFLVTAIDPFTGERIGNWTKEKGTGTLPCAAITHSDSRDKNNVTLYWTPPKSRSNGDVDFIATILQSKAVYYSEQIADIVKNQEFDNY